MVGGRPGLFDAQHADVIVELVDLIIFIGHQERRPHVVEEVVEKLVGFSEVLPIGCTKIQWETGRRGDKLEVRSRRT